MINSRKTLAHWMLGIAKPVLPPLSLTVLFRTLDQLLGVCLLVVAAKSLGEIATGKNVANIVTHTVLLMISISLIKAFLRYLEQFSGHYVAFRSLEMIRKQFFAKLCPQAPAVVSLQKSGDILSRATKDIDRLEVFFAHTFPPIITSVLVPSIVLTLTATFINPTIALIAFPLLILIALVIPFLGNNKAREYTTKLVAIRAHIAQEATDNIQGTAEIIEFNQIAARLKNLNDLTQKAAKYNRKLIKITTFRQVCNTILLFTTLSWVTLTAGRLYLNNSIDIVQLVCCPVIILSLFSVVKGAQDVSEDLEKAFSCANRVYNIVQTPPVVKEPANPVDFPSEIKNISFDKVVFDYPENRNALSSEHSLNEVSFTLNGHERTCLVGKSGSGKSTTAHLLLRFWDPQSGNITINGINLKNFSIEELRKNITVVSQVSHLFNLSIKDNLLLANPNATTAEIINATKLAALHDEIMLMPDKYETVIGEMGAKLSGGQKQRLNLARAFLTPAKVIILDEYTSSLDATNENLVRTAIEKAKPEATIIEITHRLETINQADAVIVLDKGKIVEAGNPTELVDSSGALKQLLSFSK